MSVSVFRIVHGPFCLMLQTIVIIAAARELYHSDGIFHGHQHDHCQIQAQSIHKCRSAGVVIFVQAGTRENERESEGKKNCGQGNPQLAELDPCVSAISVKQQENIQHQKQQPIHDALTCRPSDVAARRHPLPQLPNQQSSSPMPSSTVHPPS